MVLPEVPTGIQVEIRVEDTTTTKIAEAKLPVTATDHIHLKDVVHRMLAAVCQQMVPGDLVAAMELALRITPKAVNTEILPPAGLQTKWVVIGIRSMIEINNMGGSNKDDNELLEIMKIW